MCPIEKVTSVTIKLKMYELNFSYTDIYNVGVNDVLRLEYNILKTNQLHQYATFCPYYTLAYRKGEY